MCLNIYVFKYLCVYAFTCCKVLFLLLRCRKFFTNSVISQKFYLMDKTRFGIGRLISFHI